MEVDVLIVGAGLAGLSAARALAASGHRVRVLERSHRPGGRSASKAPGPRPAEGPVVDFGPVFVHGDDPAFVAWVETLPGLVPGWPHRVVGTGAPCQPAAFEAGQRRWALAPGLAALADDLAQGVDLVGGVSVEALEWQADRIVALDAEGRRWTARHLVLALAADQARALTAGVCPGAHALLASFASLPCLTVLARYAPGTPDPGADLFYPEGSRALLLVSNEGSKRGLGPDEGVWLTLQARPAWSKARLEVDRDLWARELLDEAGRVVGPWAAQPQALTAHRWRFARLGPADHLVRPAIFDKPGSQARLGLVGDLFDPDGGLQGAWRSGQRLGQLWEKGPGGPA